MKHKDLLHNLSAMSLTDLRAKFQSEAKEGRKLSLEMGAQKGPKDVHAAAKKRRELAIIKTIISEKQRTEVNQ
jgi:ribosomal protein L29